MRHSSGRSGQGERLLSKRAAGSLGMFDATRRDIQLLGTVETALVDV